MVIFFLCWGFISLLGTLFALGLIWSGKRNSREADTDLPDLPDLPQPSRKTQPAPIKLLA
jgi:hypothetical protein